MSPDHRPCSLRELARQLGVRLNALQKAAKLGRLSPGGVEAGPGGRLRVVDAEVAARLWAQNRTQSTPRRAGKAESPARVLKMSPKPGPETTPVVPSVSPEPGQPQIDPTDPVTLVDAQIRVAVARAKKLEMETLVSRKELLDRRVNLWEREAASNEIRDAMLNLITRVGPSFVALGIDQHVCHTILDGAIRELLDETGERMEHAEPPEEAEEDDEGQADS